MGIDVQGLNENALRTLKNSDEFVRKYIEFLSAPAGTITMEYYDEFGNLKTATFDNRNKLVQDLIANLNNAMTKILYLDYINGNDGNDGSLTNPLKTPEEALSRIPNGGWGVIWLLTDVTCDTTKEAVDKDNISVVFGASQDVLTALGRNPKISFINNRTQILKGNNNRLWFRNIDSDFQFTGLASPVSLFAWNTHVYQGDASFNMNGGIGFYNCNISISTDNDTGITLIDSMPAVRLEYVNVSYTNATGNDAFHFANAKSVKVLGVYGSSLTINGAASTFEANILNVVKDANGTPRNIITNLIL